MEEFQINLEQLELDGGKESSQQVSARRGSIIRRSSVLMRASISDQSQKEATSPRDKDSSDSDPNNPQDQNPQNQTPVPKIKVIELWNDFKDLHEAMLGELLSIEQHWAVKELDLEIQTALREHGMSFEMLGNVERSKISVDGIDKYVQKRKDLEGRGMVIPPTLDKLYHALDVIGTVRRTILEDEWDRIPKMLEEMSGFGSNSHTSGGTSGQQLPEYCRKEIKAVRYEAENRWIMTNLSQGIAQGAFVGELESADLSVVQHEHLIAAISACKGMNPRTTAAKNFIYTAEMIVPLRKLLQVSFEELYLLFIGGAIALYSIPVVS